MLTRFCQSFVLAATFFGASSFVGPANLACAQSSSQIDRSIDFLESSRRGKDMLGSLHFGGKYLSHEVLSTHRVTDRSGKILPGHWALKVRFDWDTSFGANTTTGMFLFDELGDLYEINALKTTSILSQPFDLANGTIQVLGSLILEAMKDSISKEDRASIQKSIDNADAKGLMITSLNIQRRLGL